MTTSYWKGKKLPLETRRKMSEARSGSKNPNWGKRFSKEHRKKLSLAHLGKFSPRTAEWNRKVSESKIGDKNPMWKKEVSIETRMKRSNSMKGEKSHLWRGGITKEHQVIRTSLKYRIWRNSVFKRDNYTCVLCGNNDSGTLNADHIKQFAYHPELRFEISNGRTLCVDCHKKTPNYGYKGRIYGN